MKMLNRIVSVFLTLAVMLSMCITPVMADAETTLDKTGVAAERLYALDILNNSDMSADANKVVTRAEFTSLMMRAIGMQKVDCNKSHFSDITPDHWAYNAINLACDLGYISEAESFEPTQPILYDDAIKMLVLAANYSRVANDNGGYPGGYMTVANSTFMTKDVHPLADRTLTLETTAILLDNFLQVEMYDSVIGTLGHITVMERYLKTDLFGVEITAIDLRGRTITFNSKIYEVGEKVNLSLIVEGKADICLKDTGNDEIVVHISQRGDKNVLIDFICEVNESNDYIEEIAVKDIEEIYLKNACKRYDVDMDLEIWYNDQRLNPSDYVALVGTFARVYLRNNYVYKIEAFPLLEGGIIYSAHSDQIIYTRGEFNRIAIEEVPLDRLTVYIDGIPYSSLQPLRMDMLFDYWMSEDGSECIIVASSRHYSKTLTGKRDDALTLDDTEYAIDSRYGVYVYDVIKERYIKNDPLNEYFNKTAEVYVDDNMCVRYIKIRKDVAELNTFYGVVTGWKSDGAFDGPGTMKIYKITGGSGEKEYTVSENIKRDSDNKDNDYITLDYARSTAKNVDGEGFFKFTLNPKGEISRIEKVPLWGNTFTYSGGFSKTAGYKISNLYIKTSKIFGVFNDRGEFTVKELDFDKNLRNTKGAKFNVTSDYDPLYNPLPDYVMLSGADLENFYGSEADYIVTKITETTESSENDEYYVEIINQYGTYKSFIPKEEIDSRGITKNMLVKFRTGRLGRNLYKVVRLEKDWSIASSKWVTENANWTPETSNGFYKVDSVLYADTEVVQFMINGEPTHVIPWNEYGEVYELVHGNKTSNFVTKSRNQSPLMYTLNGNYNVWVYLYDWGDGATVGMVIMEKK